MARHDPKARTETSEAKPRLHHAAVKGAAALLHKHGHIDEATYDDIARHSDRHIKAKRDGR